MVTRRRVLQAGVAGALALGVGGWWAWRVSPHAPTASALPPAGREVLAGIVPVMLDGALPGGAGADTVARVIDGVERAVAGLAPATQAEIGQLFGLLALAPFRALFCDVAAPWPQADAREIQRFLTRWRNSHYGLLHSGYAALHDLIYGAWYADESNWDAIGYPGPPEVLA